MIATKFGWGRGRDDNSDARGRPEYVRQAIDGSLAGSASTTSTSTSTTALTGSRPSRRRSARWTSSSAPGKVRFIGSSNFSAAQVEEADTGVGRAGLARFVTAQNRYSLLDREAERDLVPVCERLGIGVIPYFPLESGLLTGKYRRGEPIPTGTRLAGRFDVSDEQWQRIEALEAFGRERGRSLLEVAVAGLAAQPAVASVIAGATKPEQVRANAAAGSWELSGAGRRGAPGAAVSDSHGRRWRPAGSAVASFCWRSTRPVSEWLVARLDPQPGQVVLDLAAGTGETGFLAAPRLAPGGRLITGDREPGMVEAARARRGAELGVTNAEFRAPRRRRARPAGRERRRGAQPLRLHPARRPAAGARARSAACCGRAAGSPSRSGPRASGTRG